MIALFHLDAVGQVGDPRFSGRPTDIPEQSDSIISRQALKHYYLEADDLSALIMYKDTSLDNGYMFVDPARRQSEEYIHLGYQGSSASPLSFISPTFKGYHIGFHQYDIYKQDQSKFRFYQTNRTLADLAFYQISGNQNNFIAKADYGQQFKDDISVSLNFKRYNFEGAYRGSTNQSTSFGLGLLYNSKKSAYKGYLALFSSANNETVNGGINEYSDLSAQFSTIRSAIAVQLDNTKTRHSDRSIKLHLERLLVGNSTKAYLDSEYKWRDYFYSDVGPLDANDSTQYVDYVVDNRGIRFQLKDRTFSNGLYLDATLFKKLTLNAGIVHDYISIERDVNTSIRNDLSLMYEGIWQFNKAVGVNVNGHFGLGSNAGNFLINANTSLKWKDYIGIDLGWQSYLKEPSTLVSYLSLNSTEIYDNNLTKILGTQLYAKASIPYIGLFGSIRQDLVNNAIYFDQVAQPVQSNDLFSSTKFEVNTRHKFWKIGIENKGIYQVFSNNLYNLPSWYSTHNIYFESKLFKKVLLLRMGSNARIIPEYQPQKFNPLVGQFHQGDMGFALYPEWSVYIMGKIDKFRIVVEYENLGFWFTNRENFNIADYAYNDASLKFGVRWILLD